MSNDGPVIRTLIATLEDGRKGYEQAALHLTDADRPELVTRFSELAQQRARFSAELERIAQQSFAQQNGGDIEGSGSFVGRLHRAWLALKDTITGSDPDVILRSVEQGEEHAVSAYTTALEEDISISLRAVIRRQYSEIRDAHGLIEVLAP